MLDFEQNISYQTESDDFHLSIRRLSFLIVLGSNFHTKTPQYVVSIIIFQIMKNQRDERIIFLIFHLKIAAVAQRNDEFLRSMAVVLDFWI
jgi:hypothetical protein